MFSAGVFITRSWDPIPVVSDPLVRMPGTQPQDGVSLENPNQCFNCHSNYDPEVEPGSHWMGSMMAQAARDFIFWSAMAVAAQDAIWAVGNPNATDICLRCHFPKGWLEGRSDPTNASLMTGYDFDGVQCDFCHRMNDPFFEGTYDGSREGNDWLGYWDETGLSSTPSQPAADQTHALDAAEAISVLLFNGNPFFLNYLPSSPTYIEATSGQYFVSADASKRASFSDAAVRHPMYYSRFHKSKYFCGTCHDVSNPVLANLGQDGTQPLTTETQFAGSYFHVERTFSEFMLSAYGQQGGAPGEGSFDPAVFDTSLPGDYIGKCQDCHMYDVVGAGAKMNDAVVRPIESIEHPQSGQPLHDMTGGNVWVPFVLASAIPGSPNYDAVNDQLLNQGAALLTLDLDQGLGIDPVALIAGSERAALQLQMAASLQGLQYDPATGALQFRIHNQTGHKLISGFPEGRRMFANIRVYSGGQLVWEANPYDHPVGTLRGLPGGPPLGTGEAYLDALVYEMHPSSSLTGEAKTLHFVLADDRYKDNRIPPKGFDFGQAAQRLVQPRWEGADAPGYFTAAEYAGGYDQVDLVVPTGADHIEIALYYQTTSREYIHFLREEINGTADTLPDPAAYIIQTDPFFNQLKAWGETVWQLWEHNKDLPGAAPYLMTQATIDVPAPPTATPTATSPATPTATGTATATQPATATATAPPTATPTATSSSTPTATGTATATQPATATPTATASATASPLPATATASPTGTATATAAASSTATPSATAWGQADFYIYLSSILNGATPRRGMEKSLPLLQP